MVTTRERLRARRDKRPWPFSCWSRFGFNTDYYVISGQYRGADWKSGYGIKLDNQSKAACEADVAGGQNGTAVHHIRLEYVEISGSHSQADTCNEQGVEFLNGS